MQNLETFMSDFKPPANSKAGKEIAQDGVVESSDFKRIFALPRRESIKDYSDLLTQAYAKYGSSMRLRELQAAVLHDLWKYGGVFGPMAVGSGKTLVSFLAPMLIKAKRPLLLVPANLLHKTKAVDFPELSKHWMLHPHQRFLSHEFLGHEKNADALLKTMPDFIAIDEAHLFKNPKAARTKRLLRYIDAARAANKFDLKVMLLSGSMTRNSIRDYWHLITRAIPNSCPLPFSWKAMDQWANALDAEVNNRVEAGALLKFCNEEDKKIIDPTIRARRGFHRRLIETPGVVASKGSGFSPDETEPGLNISEVVPPDAPDVIKKAFYDLRKEGATPSGELVTDAMSLWRHAGELAFGFYSRWVWPDGKPDLEWLDARRDWHRLLREVLSQGARFDPPLDSNFQVYNAFSQGKLSSPEFEKWVSLKERYKDAGGINGCPPTEIVWLTDWMVMAAAKKAKKLGGGTIVWVSRPAFGKALAYILKVPYFGAGSKEIITYKGGCVASIEAHGTGKNLQHFHKNLLVGAIHGSSKYEQWMGRTHRSGQKEDTVEFHLYLHAKELRAAFDKAVAEAAYVQATMGAPPKLLKATLDFRTTDEMLKATKNNPLWSTTGFKRQKK